ncbi:alpha-Mannosidase class II a, partial [Carabus blaptoides fortunei]
FTTKTFPKIADTSKLLPMPSLAYIEDRMTRMSIVSSTALGCSSLREGQLEVMLDRKLKQDDNRGLGQGVTDNHPTRHIFRILLERRTHRCQATVENHPAGFHTISSHVASQSLLNPLIILLRNDDSDMLSERGYTAITTDIGVDVSVPFMQTGIMVNQRENNIGLVVQRQQLDTCYSDRILLQQFPLSYGTIKIGELLPFGKRAKKSSLTFLHVGAPVDLKEAQDICPMDVQAYLVRR